jgi:hypothetical protein
MIFPSTRPLSMVTLAIVIGSEKRRGPADPGFKNTVSSSTCRCARWLCPKNYEPAAFDLRIVAAHLLRPSADVGHKDLDPAEVKDLAVAQFLCDWIVIGVAVNGIDRRDRAKLAENVRGPNVSRVNNRVDTLQSGSQLGPQEVVSV